VRGESTGRSGRAGRRREENELEDQEDEEGKRRFGEESFFPSSRTS
jgi:hypothetical protein